MKITIKDIAAAVGVSPATVSLVLNNRPSRIAEETKERIKKTAEELGYKPNSAAVLLKTQRSYTLGLLIPEICNDYYGKYAKGMEDACQAKGWSTFFCTTNNNPEKERQYIETLHAKNVDGLSIITTPSNQSDPVLWHPHGTDGYDRLPQACKRSYFRPFQGRLYGYQAFAFSWAYQDCFYNRPAVSGRFFQPSAWLPASYVRRRDSLESFPCF